jgi:hypothetical protein
MAIRIRRVNGKTFAFCAAETDAMEGDIYLDDDVHYALTLKQLYETKDILDEDYGKALEQHKLRDAKETLEALMATWEPEIPQPTIPPELMPETVTKQKDVCAYCKGLGYTLVKVDNIKITCPKCKGYKE